MHYRPGTSKPHSKELHKSKACTKSACVPIRYGRDRNAVNHTILVFFLDLGQEAIQIRVRRALDVQVAAADVVEGLADINCNPKDNFFRVIAKPFFRDVHQNYLPVFNKLS